MIRFLCYNCKAVLKAHDNKAGTSMNCPRCHRLLMVPKNLTAPAANVRPAAVQTARKVQPAVVAAPYRSKWMRKLAYGFLGFSILFLGFAVLIRFVIMPTINDLFASDAAEQPQLTDQDTIPLPKSKGPDFVKWLESDDPNMQYKAAVILYDKDKHPDFGGLRAVPSYLKLLKNKGSATRTVRMRRIAAEALITLGPVLDAPKQAPVVEALKEATNDPDAEVRALAIRALGQMKSVAELSDLLKHRIKENRVLASQELAELGDAGKTAIPDLLRAIKLSPPDVKVHLASAVVRLDPTREEVIPVLLDGLKTSTDEVRQLAAESLGLMGPVAKSALGALYQVFNTEKNALVKKAAYDAYWKIYGKNKEMKKNSK
ncbi:MAG: hypothetical protein KatS3mg105_1207 [Gemmatales bacterium]|nr:MAG: hypothetical protein KatS3mg105_1207 [Gemmatales bacterium]